ncbi:hypothetical protein AGLY_008426 [Aphis glycines]|uniref:Uncharacterized protein n=1 Tax=Aphis glycines TaxID=307491 RepID=A0A6G0TL82_APHGL|nr:hypothetical protein AGLY_008426 [Aphis glycines]
MDSVDMTNNEQSLRTLIEDLLNEIIESAIETAAHKENFKENTENDEDTAIEIEIESVVGAVVEELIVSVCQSSHGGGDAPEGLPAPTFVVVDTIDTAEAVDDEDGPKGDYAANAVTEKVSQPAKGPEVRNTFGDLVGWLDAGEIPAAQELVLRKRQKRLAAALNASFCADVAPREENNWLPTTHSPPPLAEDFG